MERKNNPGKTRRLNYHRFYFLFFMVAVCAIFYYFGEIVDFFHWEAIRWGFFYSVHDIHRLIFLAPIMYAAYYFGVRPTIIILILMVSIFMPRALFISPYPDPFIRAMLFSIIAAAVGIVIARETEHRKRLEKYIRQVTEKQREIVDEIDEGILLISPDYKIRFLNTTMKQRFGDGVGSYCYEYLHKKNTPCECICKLGSAQERKWGKIEHVLPDGRKYQVIAIPYVDTDGVLCQLSILREL